MGQGLHEYRFKDPDFQETLFSGSTWVRLLDSGCIWQGLLFQKLGIPSESTGQYLQGVFLLQCYAVPSFQGSGYFSAAGAAVCLKRLLAIFNSREDFYFWRISTNMFNTLAFFGICFLESNRILKKLLLIPAPRWLFGGRAGFPDTQGKLLFQNLGHGNKMGHTITYRYLCFFLKRFLHFPVLVFFPKDIHHTCGNFRWLDDQAPLAVPAKFLMLFQRCTTLVLK